MLRRVEKRPLGAMLGRSIGRTELKCVVVSFLIFCGKVHEQLRTSSHSCAYANALVKAHSNEKVSAHWSLNQVGCRLRCCRLHCSRLHRSRLHCSRLHCSRLHLRRLHCPRVQGRKGRCPLGGHLSSPCSKMTQMCISPTSPTPFAVQVWTHGQAESRLNESVRCGSQGRETLRCLPSNPRSWTAKGRHLWH